MPQRRPASKKSQERKHASPQDTNESQGTSIASVVKARTSERARAHILSILKEAIYKMEVESKSRLSADIENSEAVNTEVVELVNTASQKTSARSRTAHTAHKKAKKPHRDNSLSISNAQAALSSSQSNTLTTSALRTSKHRAKSTEGHLHSMHRSKTLNVESSIVSLQAENMQLESKLRKLGEQLKKEQKERANLESRLAAIESSAQTNLAYKLPDTSLSRTDVPQNSPSMQAARQPM